MKKKNLKTKEEWEKIWSQFDNLQKQLLVDPFTKEKFMKESEKSRLEIYRWLKRVWNRLSELNEEIIAIPFSSHVQLDVHQWWKELIS